MIARRWVLLLERSLVLLVDDNESQVLEWQEDGTSCTKNDIVGMPRHLLLPYLDSLRITILRVVDAQSVAKDTVQSLHDLDREGDFWQEIEHLLMLIESLFDEMDIHLGLATGGNAMQEYHILLHHLKENLVVSFLLGYGKWFDLFEVTLA